MIHVNCLYTWYIYIYAVKTIILILASYNLLKMWCNWYGILQNVTVLFWQFEVWSRPWRWSAVICIQTTYLHFTALSEDYITIEYILNNDKIKIEPVYVVFEGKLFIRFDQHICKERKEVSQSTMAKILWHNTINNLFILRTKIVIVLCSII